MFTVFKMISPAWNLLKNVQKPNITSFSEKIIPLRRLSSIVKRFYRELQKQPWTSPSSLRKLIHLSWLQDSARPINILQSFRHVIAETTRDSSSLISSLLQVSIHKTTHVSSVIPSTKLSTILMVGHYSNYLLLQTISITIPVPQF